jgi:hypothetical protein
VSKKNWLSSAVDPSKAGMFKDTSTDELMKEAAHLKKTGPHKDGTHQAKRQREVLFALRARKNHGFKGS